MGPAIRRTLAPLGAALLWAGCGLVVPPLPDDTAAVPTSSPPDCSQARAQPPARGSTLAFLTTPQGTVRTYEVQAPSGCWVLLDEDAILPGPAALAVSPDGRFLYMNGKRDERTALRVYAIDTGRGALEPLQDAPFERDFAQAPGEVVATGNAIYTTTRPLSTGHYGGFWQFTRDAASGRLEWQGQAFPNREPSSLAWLPLRSTLYFFSEDLSAGPITAIRVAHADEAGTLSLVDQVSAEWGHLAVDPGGRFLWHSFEGGALFHLLDVYEVDDSGALERTASALWDRSALVVHPRGDSLYALGPDRVEGFAVKRDTGLPVSVTRIPRVGGAARLAVDPSGEWLYAVSADEVHAYRTGEAGRLGDHGRVGEGGSGVALLRVP